MVYPKKKHSYLCFVGKIKNLLDFTLIKLFWAHVSKHWLWLKLNMQPNQTCKKQTIHSCIYKIQCNILGSQIIEKKKHYGNNLHLLHQLQLFKFFIFFYNLSLQYTFMDSFHFWNISSLFISYIVLHFIFVQISLI